MLHPFCFVYFCINRLVLLQYRVTVLRRNPFHPMRWSDSEIQSFIFHARAFGSGGSSDGVGNDNGLDNAGLNGSFPSFLMPSIPTPSIPSIPTLNIVIPSFATATFTLTSFTLPSITLPTLSGTELPNLSTINTQSGIPASLSTPPSSAQRTSLGVIPSTSSTQSGPGLPAASNSSSSKSLIVAAVVAAFIVTLILLLFAVMMWRRRRRRRDSSLLESPRSTSNPTLPLLPERAGADMQQAYIISPFNLHTTIPPLPDEITTPAEALHRGRDTRRFRILSDSHQGSVSQDGYISGSNDHNTVSTLPDEISNLIDSFRPGGGTQQSHDFESNFQDSPIINSRPISLRHDDEFPASVSVVDSGSGTRQSGAFSDSRQDTILRTMSSTNQPTISDELQTPVDTHRDGSTQQFDEPIDFGQEIKGFETETSLPYLRREPLTSRGSSSQNVEEIADSSSVATLPQYCRQPSLTTSIRNTSGEVPASPPHYASSK